MRDVFNSLTSMLPEAVLRFLSNSTLIKQRTEMQTLLKDAIASRERTTDPEARHSFDMLIAQYRAELLQAKLELKYRQ